MFKLGKYLNKRNKDIFKYMILKIKKNKLIMKMVKKNIYLKLLLLLI